EVRSQVAAWEQARNNKKSTIKWRFTAEKARIKLLHLYPSIDA
ncbi:MAG: IS630 family transposase, partial [Chlorobiales bacterium]|nr:IS630 family transposase [Chlorobiales bacterium]MCX6180293.1 IS630 family transposase [Chlorobiales bacterium]